MKDFKDPENTVADKLSILDDLFADLVPEELEMRLELQVFVDPLGALAAADNNNNNNNNNNETPIIIVS